MEISFSLYFVTLLVVLYTRIINGSSDCNCHEEEWVDPDLLNRVIYDHASKTLKERPRNPPRATEVCVTNEEKASIEDELKLCKQSLNDCSKLSNDSKNGPSSKPSSKQKGPEQHECLQNKVYMKRFINILLRVSKLNEDMPQNLDIHLHITVTPKQLEILQKFSKGSNDVSLPQLDHVLSSALMSSSSNIFLEEYIPWSVVTDYIQSREMLMAVVLGCLPMFFIWKVMNGHSFKRIMIMFLASSFIISFSVTYCRIYKLAEIKQYAMMKKNPDIPVDCRPPSEPSWMDYFMPKSTLQSEVCREYYEAVMLDPFLEVTPAVVLSEMTAGFFLHPSGMLGSAIANFSKGILENLPFGTNWLVLIGSSFLIIVIIFATCGGVIKLPFYMGGLVLSGQRPQERITAGQQRHESHRYITSTHRNERPGGQS
ncbi:Chloride channel CLIC-like protein 1 [Zootermopsis nevadensis]|uniref:Chloride channel CLIC-like protein 1 n=1 Tax=Zootermopsis nevadensis TaxID=136037 RepID=A0A067QHY0_ZOONE|nr:Chloride channel CLIC-like protein 1 [Zootermopsis nevadensis]